MKKIIQTFFISLITFTTYSQSYTRSNPGCFVYNEQPVLKQADELDDGNSIIKLPAVDNATALAISSAKVSEQPQTATPSPFTILCPGNLNVATDAGQCRASVNFAATTTGTLTPTIVYTTGTTVITSPYNFPVGTTTVFATASNGVDPETTCSFTITVKDLEGPVITCPIIPPLCYNASGRYTIPLLNITDNCDVLSVVFTTIGATVRVGTSPDASGVFNTGRTSIAWLVGDANNLQSCNSTVIINKPIAFSLPDAKVLSEGVEPNTVYIGYAPAATITLKAQASGGDNILGYLWSTGATTPSISVSPTVATTYSVIITNGLGCTSIASKNINVVDIRCGHKLDKVQICNVPPGNPSNAKEKCISANGVAARLANGSYLGDCKPNTIKVAQTTKVPGAKNVNIVTLRTVPNPSSGQFTLYASSNNLNCTMNLKVFDNTGRALEIRKVRANETIQIGASYLPGIYFAELTEGRQRVTVKLIKQPN